MANDRSISGLVSHGVTFVGVIGAMTFSSGVVPGWAGWWLMGLAFHGLSVWRKQQELVDHQQDTEEIDENEASVVSEPPKEGTIAEILLALSELEVAWNERSDHAKAPDFDALSTSACALDDQLTEMKLLTSKGESLTKEVAEIETLLRSAENEEEAAIYEDELSALNSRLASHHAAEIVVRKLSAKLRTFLHQVEGLRLDVSGAVADAPDLSVRAATLRSELVASNEVSEHLAAARRAVRASRAKR